MKIGTSAASNHNFRESQLLRFLARVLIGLVVIKLLLTVVFLFLFF